MERRCVKAYEIASAKIKLMADGTVRYWYELDRHQPGGHFECSLFSEIGEPYKARFRDILDKYKLTVGNARELTAKPWRADTLIGVTASYALVEGNADHGIMYWGPFSNSEAATTYAEKHQFTNWLVIPVHPPKE